MGFSMAFLSLSKQMEQRLSTGAEILAFLPQNTHFLSINTSNNSFDISNFPYLITFSQERCEIVGLEEKKFDFEVLQVLKKL